MIILGSYISYLKKNNSQLNTNSSKYIILPNSYFEYSISLIQIPVKDNMGKLQSSLTCTQNRVKQNPTSCVKKIICHNLVEFISELQVQFIIRELKISIIDHNKRRIISVDAGGVFDKIQYLLMMKILSKLGLEFCFPIKVVYQMPIANIIILKCYKH